MSAEIPKTPELKNYKHLLERSPFEIKVNEMVKQKIQPTMRQNYFLRGVTKLESGWMIVIVDSKVSKGNIILKQGVEHSSGIQLMDVIQNKKDYKLTEAKLKICQKEMTIGYSKTELLGVLQQPGLSVKTVQPTKPQTRSPKALKERAKPTNLKSSK